MQSIVPGPNGLPVIGNAHHLARDPFKFITACRRAYGDIAALDLGRDPTFLIMNPADVERIFVTEQSKFQRPDPQPDAHALLGDGLLTTEGGIWQRQRQREQPAFRQNRISRFDDAMTGHTDDALESWPDGETISIDMEMMRLTLKILSDVMFGVTLSDAVIQRELLDNVEPLGERFVPDLHRFLLPHWVPTADAQDFHTSIAAYEDVLTDVIRERRGTEHDIHRGRAEGEPSDLLSILLRMQGSDDEVSADRLRDSLMTALLAGHDTTALMLTYSWHLLARNPTAEAQLHDELENVLGGDSPTVADTESLNYTKRILKEALRLYPPVYRLFREPKIDVRLAGHRIPAGSTLILPQWAIHRDPRWYDEPKTFDPDRWAPERAADRPQYTFFPFGGGIHRCIGEQFALLEGQLIIATVAQRYRLSLAGDSSLNPIPSLTMHPDHPIEMVAHQRS